MTETEPNTQWPNTPPVAPGAAVVRKLTAQPGDGFRYDLLIVGPILGETSCGVLGTVDNGYLVVLGNGSSYLFQDNHQPLGWAYVAEKLHLGYTSAKVITRLIGQALDRPVVGCE